MARSSTDAARLQQGPGAILSLARAAELLPWHERSARAWLYRQGLVHRDPDLGPVVSWREVQAAVERLPRDAAPGAAPDPPPTPPKKSARPRLKLT